MYYFFTIKGSRLCCTPLQWSIYFFQTIIDAFISFLSASCFNSSVFASHHWNFISLVYYCRFRWPPVSFALFELNSYFTLALVLSVTRLSASGLPSLSLSSNQSWFYWLGLPKALSAVSYEMILKNSSLLQHLLTSDVAIPPKPCRFSSIVNFCWISLSPSFITSILQDGLAAVLECSNSLRLSWILCSRCHFGLTAVLLYNLKKCQCLERCASMWSWDVPCVWR